MPMLENGDQASGLRRLTGAGGVKVIAVTSGKGGVGKTNVAVNLAVSLARQGCATLLLDADLGLANVDVVLGLHPRATLSQVLSGELELADILLDGPAGLKVIPASSGVSRMADLSLREQSGLISAFSSLPCAPEVMIVDTGSGIDRTVTGFCQAAHEVVVVVCDEPASVTDAYALIKVLSRERAVTRFQILCNRVRNEQHGRTLFAGLLAVCDRFLDVSLGYFGMIPEDLCVRRAVRQQQAVVEAFPSSPAGRGFKILAGRADKWPTPVETSGRPAFFLERPLERQALSAEVLQ